MHKVKGRATGWFQRNILQLITWVSTWPDRINIGLFESIVFSRPNHFELQYLNPVIFYRTVEQMVGSPDNAMIGAGHEHKTRKVY